VSLVHRMETIVARHPFEVIRLPPAFTLTVWRPFVLLRSPLFEIALVLVRLDHVASVIVNPDQSRMRTAIGSREPDCVCDGIGIGTPQRPEWQRIRD
jgi:hypothetical protein